MWSALTQAGKTPNSGRDRQGMILEMRARREEFSLDPALDFLRLLWAVEHGLQRASKRMEATLGVTGPQRLVLRVVGRFPGISAGELARIVLLHPSTITGILQRLVISGLLVRERDPEDSRRVRLRLTPRAQTFTRVSRGTVERAVTRALGRAAASDVRAAQEVLSAVADAVHEINEPDPKRGTRGPARRKRSMP
jgi:DNA-binding MarR family transcriptional regulator